MHKSRIRLIKALGIGAVIMLPTAPPAVAQSEAQLRSFFEGRTVSLKLEMPGAQEGVDVYPGAAQAIDFPKYASRLKRFGMAYRPGNQAMITRVKVKDDLIEFQLGGGGYGTFGDDASPWVGVPLTPKTEREKNLEKDVERTTDPAQQRRIREEMDALRRDRQREDVRIQAEAVQAQQTREMNIRQRRAEGGSRFNIRYQAAVPLEAVTPEAVMRALEQYIDFSSLVGVQSSPVREN